MARPIRPVRTTAHMMVNVFDGSLEPDIDYYEDVGAHALLEVLTNKITGGVTDPRTVYVLRWIAGRHAGIAEFAPPYTIEAAA